MKFEVEAWKTEEEFVRTHEVEASSEDDAADQIDALYEGNILTTANQVEVYDDFDHAQEEGEVAFFVDYLFDGDEVDTYLMFAKDLSDAEHKAQLLKADGEVVSRIRTESQYHAL